MKIFYYVWKNVYFCQFLLKTSLNAAQRSNHKCEHSKVAPIDSQWLGTHIQSIHDNRRYTFLFRMKFTNCTVIFK